MPRLSKKAEWLSFIDISGPFLSVQAIDRVFPQGFDSIESELKSNLRLAYKEWQSNQEMKRPDPAIHCAWVEYVLTEVLGLEKTVFKSGTDIPPHLKVHISQHFETIKPDYAIISPPGKPDAGSPRLLIKKYEPGVSLEKVLKDSSWKVSPAARMLELLRGTGVQMGIVTNGEQWMLVNAPPDEIVSYITWHAQLWFDEDETLRAFISLLGLRRFFGVAECDTLRYMLKESLDNQQELTDLLGFQVRQAVEVIVRTLDRVDMDSKRQLLGNIEPQRLYEAALSIMMRLVFLFCAEERNMLPIDDDFYKENYAISTMIDQLMETADKYGEEILERRQDAWCRLLATFRVIHNGIYHDRLNQPAYGGQLFDPDRFPFLEGRADGTSWKDSPAAPLPIDNRTVLHILRALQYLDISSAGNDTPELRRLSFRALDIEEIGYVYEGLLDHSAFRADEPVLGLIGSKNKKKDSEPEIPVSLLMEKLAQGEDELIRFLSEQSGKTESSIKKEWDKKAEPERIAKIKSACGGDDDLFNKIIPFANLIRDDSFGYPMVVRTGGFYVTEGTDRRTTGTHYTPKQLTEPIVRYTLEPIIYEGPAEGKPEEEWKLKSPSAILDLKICDMAMGSGAFLVQACRYMSELLVESWEIE